MKKINLKTAKEFISKATKRTKKAVLNANDTALTAVENAVTESIDITAQWQKVTDKALQGGLKLAANQQDLIFDALYEVKNQIKAGKKKFSKSVA